MNNSDQNDFENWQNGDDNDMNNPNNWPPKGGFFYYGPPSESFKNLWNSIGKDDFMHNMKDYMNMDDILNQWGKEISKKNNTPKKNMRQKQNKVTNFGQDDYLKLIEIRGYLAITEQFAHVKALDKLLSQIIIIPKENK